MHGAQDISLASNTRSFHRIYDQRATPISRLCSIVPSSERVSHGCLTLTNWSSACCTFGVAWPEHRGKILSFIVCNLQRIRTSRASAAIARFRCVEKFSVVLWSRENKNWKSVENLTQLRPLVGDPLLYRTRCIRTFFHPLEEVWTS